VLKVKSGTIVGLIEKKLLEDIRNKNPVLNEDLEHIGSIILFDRLFTALQILLSCWL